jgi:PRTRC genetic system protein A
MFKPAGYLLSTKEGIKGQCGLIYDYILAENGLFIEAHSALIKARINIAPANVRGLAPLTNTVELIHGKIPSISFDLALSACTADPCKERYLAVTWVGKYEIKVPVQDRRECGVDYEKLPNTVLDIHSHGKLPAFFSLTDNKDEVGLKLFLVFGCLDTSIPEYLIRVGVYGYFVAINKEEVFG